MIKEYAQFVYIAGPLSRGETASNVYTAIKAGHDLLDAGHVPYVPHLDIVMTLQRPRVYEDWIAADNIVIERCDALWRLPGASPGADKEVELAISLGLDVYYNFESLILFCDEEAEAKSANI